MYNILQNFANIIIFFPTQDGNDKADEGEEEAEGGAEEGQGNTLVQTPSPNFGHLPFKFKSKKGENNAK